MQSADPQKPLLFDPNYFDHEDDIKVIVEGAKRAVQLVENSTTFRSIGGRLLETPFPPCAHVEFKSDLYWEVCTKIMNPSFY